MCSVVLFLVLVAAVTKAELDEKCFKMFHPDTMFCCVNPPPRLSDKLDLKECAGLPTKPFSTCEKDACIGKKNGYVTADGKIDKTSLQNMIEKEFKNQPEFVELVKNKCIDTDISMYGPQDFCDTIKMKNCMQLQFLVQCPEFSDEGDCSGTTALVEECTKLS